MTDREIVLSRSLNAPAALAFEAWSRPEHLDRWMGPDGFTTTTRSMDFRVGGEWLYTMAHATHGVFPNRVRYLEIVPGERLVYDHDAGEASDDPGFRVTVTFRDLGGGRCELTMHSLFPTAEACEAVKRFGAVEGGEQTLTHLADALEADAERDFVFVRELKAPVARVWAAWTEAAHLGRWWGPKGFQVDVLTLDLRPGGLFHYAMTAPADHPMAGRSYGRMVYDDVTPRARLAWVNSFSDADGGVGRHPLAPGFPAEIYNGLTFEEIDGGTRLTLRGRPLRASAEERENYVKWKASLNQGFGGTFDQLEAHLAS